MDFKQQIEEIVKEHGFTVDQTEQVFKCMSDVLRNVSKSLAKSDLVLDNPDAVASLIQTGIFCMSYEFFLHSFGMCEPLPRARKDF
jgi:hypothetical protein